MDGYIKEIISKIDRISELSAYIDELKKEKEKITSKEKKNYISI